MTMYYIGYMSIYYSCIVTTVMYAVIFIYVCHINIRK